MINTGISCDIYITNVSVARSVVYGNVIGCSRGAVKGLNAECQVSVGVNLLFGQAFLLAHVEVPCRVRALAELAEYELDAVDLLAVLRKADLARVSIFVYDFYVHLRLLVNIDEVSGI